MNSQSEAEVAHQKMLLSRRRRANKRFFLLLIACLSVVKGSRMMSSLLDGTSAMHGATGLLVAGLLLSAGCALFWSCAGRSSRLTLAILATSTVLPLAGAVVGSSSVILLVLLGTVPLWYLVFSMGCVLDEHRRRRTDHFEEVSGEWAAAIIGDSYLHVIDEYEPTLTKLGFARSSRITSMNHGEIIRVFYTSGDDLIAMFAFTPIAGKPPGCMLSFISCFDGGCYLQTAPLKTPKIFGPWFMQTLASDTSIAQLAEQHRSGTAFLATRGFTLQPAEEATAIRYQEKRQADVHFYVGRQRLRFAAQLVLQRFNRAPDNRPLAAQPGITSRIAEVKRITRLNAASADNE